MVSRDLTLALPVRPRVLIEFLANRKTQKTLSRPALVVALKTCEVRYRLNEHGARLRGGSPTDGSKGLATTTRFELARPEGIRFTWSR